MTLDQAKNFRLVYKPYEIIDCLSTSYTIRPVTQFWRMSRQQPTFLVCRSWRANLAKFEYIISPDQANKEYPGALEAEAGRMWRCLQGRWKHPNELLEAPRCIIARECRHVLMTSQRYLDTYASVARSSLSCCCRKSAFSATWSSHDKQASCFSTEAKFPKATFVATEPL